jgi:hypothetical protein
LVYFSALTARRRLPTLDPIRLASPEVRRDPLPLSTVTFSGVFSIELSGTDDSLRVPMPNLRPNPSRGVTGAGVLLAILLAGDPLTLRDTSPDAKVVTNGELSTSSGSSNAVDIGRWLAYSLEKFAWSLGEYLREAPLPTSVIARLGGRLAGLLSISSAGPSARP